MNRGTLKDYYKNHNQLNNVSNKAYKVEVRHLYCNVPNFFSEKHGKTIDSHIQTPSSKREQYNAELPQKATL